MTSKIKEATGQDVVFPWRQGIEEIVAARQSYAELERRRAEQAIDVAERTLAKVTSTLDAARIKFGKKSGNPRYQRAVSASKSAQRNVTHAKAARQEVLTIPLRIDKDQALLIRAIEQYLAGNRVPISCGTIQLDHGSNGNLSIYFRKDGKPVVRKQSHGHFVVRPDGRMSYMRMHGDKHGLHNVVDDSSNQ